MDTLKQVLMNRDGMTSEEAEAEIAEAKMILQEYLDNDDMVSAHDICEELWGLEPDYLNDLIY